MTGRIVNRLRVLRQFSGFCLLCIQDQRTHSARPLLLLCLLLSFGGWLHFAAPAARAQPQDDGAPSTLLPLETQLFLPQLRQGAPSVDMAQCPLASAAEYGTVPTLGTLSQPAAQSPDLNLTLRGYRRVVAPLHLVDLDGDTDSLAPQIAAIFADGRAPAFRAAYRVYNWEWACIASGCKGQLLSEPPVTLVALDSQPQEPLGIPARAPEIYNGGYIALVLYAEETRLTLTYTRDNSPARGYVVHLEDFCVDPNLLALYRQMDAQGRAHLPAVLPQDIVGHASNLPLKLAIRDEGTFLDPRSRKDWWVGY